MDSSSAATYRQPGTSRSQLEATALAASLEIASQHGNDGFKLICVVPACLRGDMLAQVAFKNMQHQSVHGAALRGKPITIPKERFRFGLAPHLTVGTIEQRFDE